MVCSISYRSDSKVPQIIWDSHKSYWGSQNSELIILELLVNSRLAGVQKTPGLRGDDQKEPQPWKDAQQGRKLSTVPAALDTGKPAGHWDRKGRLQQIVLELSKVRDALSYWHAVGHHAKITTSRQY